MKNIYYAEEVSPEYSLDYNPFWQDFTPGNAGTWLDDFLIMPGRYHSGKTNELFDRITGNAEEATEATENFEYMSGYYKNLTEYLNDTFKPVKPYNTRQIHRIKELLPLIYEKDDPEAIAELMTITSGEEWETYALIGYCQGDYATAIYKPEHHSKEGLEDLNTMYWNGGTAYNVYCNGEMEVGIYTTKWDEDERKEELASIIGCTPAELFFDEEEAEEALNATKLAALEREAGTPI